MIIIPSNFQRIAIALNSFARSSFFLSFDDPLNFLDFIRFQNSLHASLRNYKFTTLLISTSTRVSFQTLLNFSKVLRCSCSRFSTITVTLSDRSGLLVSFQGVFKALEQFVDFIFGPNEGQHSLHRCQYFETYN